jgi:hypothetical protein
MDKYNAQEPRTVNTINNGNITLLYIHNNTIIYTITLLIMEVLNTIIYPVCLHNVFLQKKLSKATYLVSK